MTLVPGDTLLGGKYRIEGLIGQGAFGQVYKAWDTTLKRWMAIKELRRDAPGMGSTRFDDYVRRFRREAEVQAQFNHPHIVHVYELIDLGDMLYLVMEYADGPNLRDYLSEHGSLPVDESVRITLQVLDALLAVHENPLDIIHRDIKPSNILLTAKKQVKLTDFGLAQVGQESHRTLGPGEHHPGTPMYMSPEQEDDQGYLRDESDLYSLGCVLFEMLTSCPYKQALRRGKHLHDLRAGVPEALETIVRRAAQKEPAARYQKAQEFLAALAGSQADREVAAAMVGKRRPIVAQGDDMQPGEVLGPGQSISSASGQYTFIYQGDGNLVLYRNRDKEVLWKSDTPETPAGECRMQGDGNLVIYDPAGRVVWAWGTEGHPGSRLFVQDDGNVVIFDPGGHAVKATDTVQPVPPTSPAISAAAASQPGQSTQLTERPSAWRAAPTRRQDVDGDSAEGIQELGRSEDFTPGIELGGSERHEAARVGMGWVLLLILLVIALYGIASVLLRGTGFP